jgi:hypothetical protein
MLALSVDSSNATFSQLWRGPADTNGSPIVAGGRVWVTSYTNGVLYGLNPQTGAVEVRQSTPAMEHFTSPSASDGQLVLATGATVEAYTVAAAVVAGDTLSVAREGTGSGTVQGTGIACPPTCTHSYPPATEVTLTETPAPGSRFAGWSGGGCSGSATTCAVTLTADAVVTATFSPTAGSPSAGRPTVSGSLSGVAKGKPRLTVKVRAGAHAPALSAIVLAPPRGTSFRRRRLGKGVTVTGSNGRHVGFTATLRRGVLTISPKRPQRSVKVIVHDHALAVSRDKRRRKLTFRVRVVDAGGTSTRLTLTLRG